MKTRLLLLILMTLFMGVKTSHASEVFPTSDAIWVIHMYNNGTYQYVYGLSGDTLINEMTYQKLYLLNDTTLTIDSEDIYVAGIRQTPEMQVFIQPADKKDGSKFEEYLMYDFGEEVGEEIIHGKKPRMGWDYNGPTFESVIKENISEVISYLSNISEDEFGLIFYLYTPLGEYWRKGIGSLSGLFFSPFDYTLGDGFQGCELVCMKENDKVKYMLEDCTSCFNKPFYGTGIENQAKRSIAVAYNTEEGNIQIKIDNESIYSIFSLIKLDGLKILEDRLSDTYTSINVSHIPKGIYVHVIKNESTTQSGKLIIK